MNYQKKNRFRFYSKAILLFSIFILVYTIGFYSFGLTDLRYYTFTTILFSIVIFAQAFWMEGDKWQKGIKGEDMVEKVLLLNNIRHLKDFYLPNCKSDIDFIVFLKGNIWLLEVKNRENITGNEVHNELQKLEKRRKELERMMGEITTKYPTIRKRIVFINNNSPKTMEQKDLLDFKDFEKFITDKIIEQKDYDHELEGEIFDAFKKHT